jgi:hypothetical protein
MKKIVYERAGKLYVVNPAPEAKRATETDDAFIERIKAKDVPPDATDVRILEDAEIPSDRSTRGRWKLDGNKLIVERNR